MIDRVKILHVLWAGHSGGAERFVRDITAFSDKTKFEHQVVFLSNPGRFGKAIAENGIVVHGLGMAGSFSLKNGFGFRKVLQSFRPDIIHNHSKDFFSNFLILCARHTPKIFFEHGGDLIGDKPNRDILFYYCFARFYDLVFTNSEYMRKRIVALKRVNPRKVRTFYIGIDPMPYEQSKNQQLIKQQLKIDAHKNVIGIVCRLVGQKGVDDFIKVAEEIQRTYREIVFLVVGDGEKRALLEMMAAHHNVDIRFLGDRSDVPDLLSIFDIFLFTSKWEPFGIVLLEAMAARVPVLGFAVGGASEIINKGGGVLLEERDHKKLAELTVEILEDRATYQRLSAMGYANLTANFHIKKSVKLLEKEYVVLLARL